MNPPLSPLRVYLLWERIITGGIRTYADEVFAGVRRRPLLPPRPAAGVLQPRRD